MKTTACLFALFLFSQALPAADLVGIVRSPKPNRIDGLIWLQPLLHLGSNGEKFLIARGSFVPRGRVLSYAGRKLALKKERFKIMVRAETDEVNLVVEATQKKTKVREEVTFRIPEGAQFLPLAQDSAPTSRDLASASFHDTRGRFSISPRLSYFRIVSYDRSNGGRATLTSKSNYGFSLDGSYGRTVWVLAGARFLKVGLNSPSTASLENAGILQWGARVGIGFSADRSRAFQFAGGYLIEAEPVVELAPSGSLTIESSVLHRIFVQANFRFLSAKAFSLSLQTEGRGLLPKQMASESFGFGYEYFLGLEASLALENSRFFAAFRHAANFLKSDLTDRSKTDLIADVGLEMTF